MAKARNTTPVRIRAIRAFNKAFDLQCEAKDLIIDKSRSKDTITVKTVYGFSKGTWSYKGGSLSRINS